MALTDDLVSYWRMEEASGTRYDSRNTDNDLTDVATVTRHAGKIDYAAEFISTNQEYLEITDANQTDLSFGDTSFTIAAWAYWTDITGYRFLVTKGSNANGYEYALDFVAGQGMRFYCDNGTDLDLVTTATPSVDTWYYLIGYYDKPSGAVYIQSNNSSPVSTAHTGGTQSTTSPFRIGAFGSSTGDAQFMDGYIDEVAIWNRLLTSDEKTQLYNSGNGMSYSDILATSFTPRLFWM